MSRPSDGFDLDELKEEFDWLYEFDSRMAERITHDPDVHNLVDYVNKLEFENAQLKACSVDWELDHCPNCQNVISLQFKMDENEYLRNILGKMYHLLTELCVVGVSGRRIGPRRLITPSALSCLAKNLRDIGVDVDGTYEGN